MSTDADIPALTALVIQRMSEQGLVKFTDRPKVYNFQSDEVTPATQENVDTLERTAMAHRLVVQGMHALLDLAQNVQSGNTTPFAAFERVRKL